MNNKDNINAKDNGNNLESNNKYKYLDEKKIIEIINLLTIEQVIYFSSNYLVDILTKNRGKTKLKIDRIKDPLYSNKVPIIKIEDYLIRLVKFSKMEISTLVLTFIYIKRFIDKENFIIAFNNIFRLIITCSLLAIKFNENKAFKNSFYAKIGGLEVEDLNNLEYNVFSRLNFNLRVLDSEFYETISEIYKESLNNS